jgi:hypothetical protein
LKLDPEERPTVEECLEHAVFQTERAMDRTTTRLPVKSSSAHSSNKKRRTDDHDKHTEKGDKLVIILIFFWR